jgi:hypothetical protein
MDHVVGDVHADGRVAVLKISSRRPPPQRAIVGNERTIGSNGRMERLQKDDSQKASPQRPPQ